MKVDTLARGEKRGRIYKWPLLLWRRCGEGVGDGKGSGAVNSLTISELECSTFLGLSAPLLMCEEITLFPQPGENHLL